MLRIKLQDTAGLRRGALSRQLLQHPLHLQRQLSLGGQTGRMAFQAAGQLDGADLVQKFLPNSVKQLLVRLGFFLERFFLTFALGLRARLGNRFKLLAAVFVQDLDGKLVNIIGEAKNFISLVQDRLNLGQRPDPGDTLSAGVVDILLVLLHAANIFFRRNQLVLAGGGEKQQVLQRKPRI